MAELYKIWKPDITQIDLFQFVQSKEYIENQEEITASVQKANSPKYLNWKELRVKSWIPQIFKHDKEKFWALVKFNRQFSSRTTPICDANNRYFTWQKTSHYEKFFHEIDLDMARYLLNFSNISTSDHTKYQQKGIIEEAIASSQLEGAHVTRKAAKTMIEEKRPPRTQDEKMILNNFLAMQTIQEKFKDAELSLEILFELHHILTQGDNKLKEEEKGCFRSCNIEVGGLVGEQDVVTYKAPPIEFVKTQIDELIRFANDELEMGFIHPVIKAIMLHFWIGLLHPFVDGNGRIARCLFYWYLLRKDYWAFAFLPVSVAIKNSPAQYGESYILSEQDDNDLTYFIDYNIKKIKEAVESFRGYAKRKTNEKLYEKSALEKILDRYRTLNYRQAQILLKLYKNPTKFINVSSHAGENDISKPTAINDLKELLYLDFVQTEKRGKNVFYHLKLDLKWLDE